MRIFDLHCDTATCLLHRSCGLYENDLHISLKNAEYLDSYAQVMAVFTPNRLTDGEGYSKFFDVVENLRKEVLINCEKAGIAYDFGSLHSLLNEKKTAMILSVEDARILENDISRLYALYENGVRILTLNWSGDTCIGGAHDTKNGLTDFGCEVASKCFDMGITPDISHCSFIGAEQALTLAAERKKPLIASHSNSHSVTPHTRNLLDEHFSEIVRSHGLVGINLCPPFLSTSSQATMCDTIKHIEHFLSLGGEDTLAMGCDLDGISHLPEGLSGIKDMYTIKDELQRLNYSDELIDKIMFKNAYNFFKNNF